MSDKKPKELNTMIKLRRQGAGLQDIADHIGRSASYVKTHLDNTGLDFKNKSEIEKDQIKHLARSMRHKGHTLKEIADEIDRSPSYVKNILDTLLDAEIKKSEHEFQQSDVVPFLKREKHSNITESKPHKCGGIKLEIDVESTKDGIIYYSEIKRELGSHRLMTAIGQIFFHQFGNRNSSDKNKYQLVLPQNCRNDQHFHDGLSNYLKDKLDIDVIFV